ncbi:unnamed protein product [Echinostoma caproni]|uniref:Uncharacterized protein n=1 Tax=Echinostoma caproni TaxID=27848 RepID=A0A3P8G0M7_9TREM|nr:unnamed protein product [Echinostoma caproni]
MSKPLRELLVEQESQEPVRPDVARTDNPSLMAVNCQMPEMCLTRVQRDGFHSPFRNATLDFLLNPKTSNSLGRLSNGQIGVVLSPPERQALFEWWIEFGKRRSQYVPIYARGAWTGVSVDNSATEKRKRVQLSDEPVLPASVERFIRAHDRQLAEILQLSALNEHGNISEEKDVATSATESPNPPHAAHSAENGTLDNHSSGTQPPSAQTKNAAVAFGPSESIQWLVQICSMACGSTHWSQLLTEIEMLELMLFPKEGTPEKFRQADLALISCLDLR